MFGTLTCKYNTHKLDWKQSPVKRRELRAALHEYSLQAFNPQTCISRRRNRTAVRFFFFFFHVFFILLTEEPRGLKDFKLLLHIKNVLGLLYQPPSHYKPEGSALLFGDKSMLITRSVSSHPVT